ncbi:hypothetical protein QAD02_000479 [Eretmocerus hayati]|uniref:Uncharacterized protein n=1 Tax=Eretmocerus hayati TaxID=131215 RepID=A0ACC2NDH6_9HYME|nr:hypothetical protein QAD02_000479 [Eretmocerus hayati]
MDSRAGEQKTRSTNPRNVPASKRENPNEYVVSTPTQQEERHQSSSLVMDPRAGESKTRSSSSDSVPVSMLENPNSCTMTAPSQRDDPQPRRDDVTANPGNEERAYAGRSTRRKQSEAERIQKVGRWLQDTSEGGQCKKSSVPESQPQQPHESLPRLHGAKLPHDPTMNASHRHLVPLDKAEVYALTLFKLSLSTLTSDDVSGPGFAARSASTANPAQDREIYGGDPAPSSDDEGITVHQAQEMPKESRSGTAPINHAHEDAAKPKANEGEGAEAPPALIGPPPTQRLNRRRRSRAERAARSAAWARSVLEPRSSVTSLTTECRNDIPCAPFSSAPIFSTPIFFDPTQSVTMVFFHREPLLELADRYYEQENTDTEDDLMNFVRANRSRRRTRERVARHRRRRDAAARLEARQAQEREEEFNNLLAQAVNPAPPQDAGLPRRRAPARGRSPHRRAPRAPAPGRQVSPRQAEDEPRDAAQAGAMDAEDAAHGPVGSHDEPNHSGQQDAENAIAQAVQREENAAALPDDDADPFAEFLRFASPRRPERQEPAIAPWPEVAPRAYVVDLRELVAELPDLENYAAGGIADLVDDAPGDHQLDDDGDAIIAALGVPEVPEQHSINIKIQELWKEEHIDTVKGRPWWLPIILKQLIPTAETIPFYQYKPISTILNQILKTIPSMHAKIPVT